MTLYKAVRFEWSLHQYLFSAGGSGCHYWDYNLLRVMASDPGRFHLHSDVPTHAWGVFGKWYSRLGPRDPTSLFFMASSRPTRSGGKIGLARRRRRRSRTMLNGRIGTAEIAQVRIVLLLLPASITCSFWLFCFPPS
ncbi:hypothetical protein BU26DRAFT_77771 [Trematosphaeria pertusa]|uniref:Uncharacterized protein n=1 Tax=Trematosphaeria pertusa TaxID=390896 RepID=A0A6A6I3V3_9PLEO|nr:uncharacterized protein BU26DRAFT_77771 [Trematosphaeria pertusa]KAF2245164.1 hypothetical protein BU26DRAFT_77771 [Trematosphaeria pertusa]